MTVQIGGRTAREVAESIERQVRGGGLAPGASLPSVRELSARLGLSPVTVVAALRELRRRGIVLTRARRRTIVNPRPPLPAAIAPAAVPPGVRDLTDGLPDVRLLPRGRSVRLTLPVDTYPAEAALPALVAEARKQYAEAGVRAKDICLASGALDGVQRVLEAHLVSGDGVIVEDPGYAAVFDLVRAIGLVPVPVAIDDRGPLTDPLARALRSGAKALVLTPRGQNPTGAALDEERARALREVLRKAPDLLVVEDDHQGPVAGVRGYSVNEDRRRWAVVRSVAKSLGPDLRLAFVAGDPETIGRVGGRFALGPGWVSYVLQRAALALLRSTDARAQLARAARAYAERREGFVEALAEHGIGALARSGLNAWIPVPDEATVATSLLHAGWAVLPGARFRIAAPPGIRVTVATLQPVEARRFARDLAGVLRPGSRPRVA